MGDARIAEEISVSTVARIAECSPDTVLRWIEEGLVAARRTSPRGWWRIETASLLSFLKARKDGREVKPWENR